MKNAKPFLKENPYYSKYFGFIKSCVDSSLVINLGFLLSQVTTNWKIKTEKLLTKYKINYTDFIIMQEIVSREKTMSKSLSADLFKSEMVTIKSIERDIVLESLGKLLKLRLVEYSNESPRKKILHLTKKGLNLLEKLDPILDKFNTEFFEPIKKSELETFYHMLTKLTPFSRAYTKLGWSNSEDWFKSKSAKKSKDLKKSHKN